MEVGQDQDISGWEAPERFSRPGTRYQILKGNPKGL
jgi:hypothetical protein